MFIIADQNDNIIQSLKDLDYVLWAERVNDEDGKAIQPKVESTNAEVGQSQELIGGTVLTIHEVKFRHGDRSDGQIRGDLSGPQLDAEGWFQIQSYKDKPEPDPDPVLGEDGYDYKGLRKRDIIKAAGNGNFDDAIGNQLDVIWKQLDQMKIDGLVLIEEADEMLREIQAVKVKHKKT